MMDDQIASVSGGRCTLKGAFQGYLYWFTQPTLVLARPIELDPVLVSKCHVQVAGILQAVEAVAAVPAPVARHPPAKPRWPPPGRRPPRARCQRRPPVRPQSMPRTRS